MKKVFCKNCKYLKKELVSPTIFPVCKIAREKVSSKISGQVSNTRDTWYGTRKVPIRKRRNENCNPAEINMNNDCPDFKPLSLLERLLFRQKTRF
jgi:hypothetical protein